MDHTDIKDLHHESAWQHFAIHAEQRLKMFQFYITISTALLGGGVLLLQTDQNGIALSLLGFLALFFSFVFWKLEDRTRILVRNAEDAIKYWESLCDVQDIDDQPSPLKMFIRDDFRIERRKGWSALWYFSYHDCFVMVFVVIGILGALGIFGGLTEIFLM